MPAGCRFPTCRGSSRPPACDVVVGRKSEASSAICGAAGPIGGMRASRCSALLVLSPSSVIWWPGRVNKRRLRSHFQAKPICAERQGCRRDEYRAPPCRDRRRRRGRLQSADRGGRGRDAGTPAGVAARDDRPGDSRAPWPDRKNHRRRPADRVCERRRCGALCDCDPARDGMAKHRSVAREAHSVPHRDQPWRCGGGRR